MKKLIILFLIFALFLPAAALAGESDVIGCWGHYDVLTDGAPAMTMLYLAEDHTCYFLTQMFRADKEGFGRTFIGTWEYQSDGSVFVKTGKNTSITFIFSETYVGAQDTETGDLYVNLSKYY